MKLRRFSKIMSIAMLAVVVLQISLPLTSNAMNYIAEEVVGTDEVVLTKEQFLNNKNGKFFEGGIKANGETLKYHVEFKEFSESNAIIRVNKKTIDITPEKFSGQVIDGSTKNDINYTADADGLKKDILVDLTVTRTSKKTKDQDNSKDKENNNTDVDSNDNTDNGFEGEDSEEADSDDADEDTDKSERGEETTDKPDGNSDDTNAPYFNPVNGEEADATAMNPTVITDGGKSGRDEVALIANDATVISRNKDFDGCKSVDVSGTPSPVCDPAAKADANGNTETIGVWNKNVEPTSVIAAPEPTNGEEFKEIMNVQARHSDGTYYDPADIDFTIDTPSYTADYISWTGGKEGEDENMSSEDSNANLSPLGIDRPLKGEPNDASTSAHDEAVAPDNSEQPVYRYNITFSVPEGQEVTSTLTVVNPFYFGSAYGTDAAPWGGTEFATGESATQSAYHYFGNVWGAYDVHNATLDMVLDVEYDQTSNTVDGDVTTNETTTDNPDGTVDALQGEGENAYFQSDKGNDVVNEIPGYELYVDRGSDFEDDQFMDQAFLDRYFNEFMLTAGEGADNEMYNFDKSITDPAEIADLAENPRDATNYGYAARQFDNSYDIASYARGEGFPGDDASVCMAEWQEYDLSRVWQTEKYPRLSGYKKRHITREYTYYTEPVSDTLCSATDEDPDTFADEGSLVKHKSNTGNKLGTDIGDVPLNSDEVDNSYLSSEYAVADGSPETGGYTGDGNETGWTTADEDQLRTRRVTQDRSPSFGCEDSDPSTGCFWTDVDNDWNSSWEDSVLENDSFFGDDTYTHGGTGDGKTHYYWAYASDTGAPGNYDNGGAVNQGMVTDETDSHLPPRYGYRKQANYLADIINGEEIAETNDNGQSINQLQGSAAKINPGEGPTGGIVTAADVLDESGNIIGEHSSNGVSVVDDGDYDNDIPGVYNVILGYTTGGDEGKNLTNLTGNEGKATDAGIGEIGQQDVYMILPVVVVEPVRIAADDTEIWESMAPKNEGDLKQMMDVEALQLKAVFENDAIEYDKTHACDDEDSPYLPGGNVGCTFPEEEQHYINNRLPDVKVVNHSNYNFDNPQVGEYLFTFYVDRGGANGLDEGDYQRDAELYVLPDWETINNADLRGTTPSTVKLASINGDGGYDTWYDVIDGIDLALIATENGHKIGGTQDIQVDQVQIIEDGGYHHDKNLGSILVLQVTYKGLGIQGLFAIENTWDNVPWEVSDQISMSAINPVTVPNGDTFDPIITPNVKALNKDLEEQDIEVDMDIVSPNLDGSYQVGLIGYKKLQGDFYAESYLLVDVNVVTVEDEDRTKLAVTDHKTRENFTPRDYTEFNELADAKAVNLSGEDISDLITVHDTDGFVLGDDQTTGDPYSVTFGVTDDVSGVTYTDTADFSVIGDGEYLPDVTLVGTMPIYVKLGDEVSEDDLIDLINAKIELYRNYEFYGLDDTDMHIVNADGYDPNNADTYYVEVAGTYDEPKSEIDPMDAEAIFEVIVDPNVETTQAQVVIEGSDDVQLAVGSTFDPMDGVTATSKTDGDVTDKIEILGNNVDTSKDGDYAVTYYVEDSTGSYAEVERQVRVGEGDPDAEEETDTEDDSDSEGTSDGHETDGSSPSNGTGSTGDNSLETEGLANTATTCSLAIVVLMGAALIAAFMQKKLFS